MIVYSGTIAVASTFFSLLWLYAAGGYRLVDRSLEPARLRAMTRRYVVGMTLYVFAFLISFLSPVVSLILIAMLAVVFLLPEPAGGLIKEAR